jgi:hypothetical protein
MRCIVYFIHWPHQVSTSSKHHQRSLIHVSSTPLRQTLNDYSSVAISVLAGSSIQKTNENFFQKSAKFCDIRKINWLNSLNQQTIALC